MGEGSHSLLVEHDHEAAVEVHGDDARGVVAAEPEARHDHGEEEEGRFLFGAEGGLVQEEPFGVEEGPVALYVAADVAEVGEVGPGVAVEGEIGGDEHGGVQEHSFGGEGQVCDGV